ncbi:MAG: SAM-dependent methyltransferase [Rikenellaceae bacterium]|nr:SAM-dependent methyltransferase [Rikenellaceae bacterium]
MIPCPISDETTPWEVLPEGNRRIMQSLDYFIVEQVRTARRFLSKAALGLKIDELEFVELNEHTVAGEAVERMIAPLLEGRSAGVISEAGVPGVADPGALVVEAAHRKGIRVVPLVGPSSIILAVMASGLNGQSFAFNGYLPVKGPERQKAIRFYERRALQEHQSQLFIEAPYRNQKLVEELLQTLQAETRLTIAMDLTAPTEWIVTKRVKEWRATRLPELNKRPAILIIG